MKIGWSFRSSTAVLLTLFLLPMLAAASPPEPPKAEIEASVLQQLTEQDETTAWIILNEQADLSPAFAIQDWEERGRFVYERLQAVADRSQATLRGLLQRRGVAHRSFFIQNAIQVQADRALLQELARQPAVEKIVADSAYQLPELAPGEEKARVQSEAGVQAVEWNIERINAPKVWSTFGVRGEGIVVASIDGGALFDHPALVGQYRGNRGNGKVDHNYNWFDPSEVCRPLGVPCDSPDHGTIVMGVMVGSDGGGNQIGVAPGARWITAKGCGHLNCPRHDLLAAAEWILAPTDLNGNNPRPDLRPHVVNNSWGGPLHASILQAWISAGIFPVFANGNSGPNCNTSYFPGAYSESYSVGAFDSNSNIADFSSRGPSGSDGGIKPNIAAPGVDIRSSVPGGGYRAFWGTSLAAPHLAGTVALIWSAAPGLIGNIEVTRALLDQTAVDVSDLSCGGTPGKNNVWGEGRLDAFAAVKAAPRGSTGTIQGIVTDAGTGSPIGGATIQLAGPSNQAIATDPTGRYSARVFTGTYDVSVSAFGYRSQTVTGIVVGEGATTTRNVALATKPRYTLSGYVRDNRGKPLAGVPVSILGTPFPLVATNAQGAYSFANIPEGTYSIQAGGTCHDAETKQLVVDGGKSLNFALPQRTDRLGYACEVVAPAYIEANNVLPLSGDNEALSIDLPFTFTFYGETFNRVRVSNNGKLVFYGSISPINVPIPYPLWFSTAIYPYWDALVVDQAASVRSRLLGTAPNRQFVIEWRNVAHYAQPERRVDFEVVLHESGQILMQYRNIANDPREQGNSATVGLEKHGIAFDKDGFQYSFNNPVLYDGLAIRYQAGAPRGRVYLPLIRN
jgi:subtilisin family serine protease